MQMSSVMFKTQNSNSVVKCTSRTVRVNNGRSHDNLYVISVTFPFRRYSIPLLRLFLLTSPELLPFDVERYDTTEETGL